MFLCLVCCDNQPYMRQNGETHLKSVATRMKRTKNNPFPNDEEGIINHLIIYKKTISCFLLHHDWLVLRNKSLHDTPSYEICNGTDAEHHHVGCRLAVEAEELECSLRVKCKAVL